ncbi:MAG TPA: methyltransferase domain-containing protein [Methanothrix sp.]|nr:methyltransferase domain-containing protein [Methanothrix sp.]
MDGYNQRLFKGGIRKHVHLARFRWLRDECIELHVNLSNVVEIGCFDARTIDYLPKAPARYHGFDAGWEGGLKEAIKKYKTYSFIKSTDPADLVLSEKATLVICLETLEHIPDRLLDEYFRKIAGLMEKDGYFLVSIPNETGPVFLIKYICKALYYGNVFNYSLKDVCAATLGRTDMIRRHSHRGFSWRDLLQRLEKHFKIVKVVGIQIPWLPPSFNINIGIVCRIS